MSSNKEQKRPEPPKYGCHFFVERKQRYCRFHPTKDTNFCAEHATVLGADLGRKRMVCPYDSKHTCYTDKLNHHMKICPSRPKEMPPYYSHAINSGDNGGENVPEPKETVLTVSEEELQLIIDKVNKLYDKHIGALEEEVLSHACMKKELENATYGTAALRHRKQQASLIGQMERRGLLKDNMCFLEMGAGKGQLSHWLHSAVANCNNICFVLIDRSHVRNKMDNLHKEEMIMERIRIDIEHLRLGRVPSIEKHTDHQVVAFGKHLCGPATDLALRCVTETLNPASEREEETPRKRLKSDTRQLSGAVIALCCHHRCNWIPYVGKGFFKSNGLGAREFQVISSMSSWATCAWKGWSHKRKAGSQSGNKDEEKSRLNDDMIEHEMFTSGNMKNTETVNKETNEELQTIEKVFEVKDMSELNHNVGTDKDHIQEEDAQDEGVDDDHIHEEDADAASTSINSRLSQHEREVIGRKCKRLIDHGRVKFLEEHGLDSSLKIYIEEYYTPENVMLVATSSAT